MRLMMLYTVLGVVLGAVTDAVGASMPVSFMVAIVGPPALHLGWLVLRQRGGW